MPSPESPDAAWPERLAAYRAQLDCRFPQVGEVFEACLLDALRVLSPAGVSAYLECGRFLGRMGRGVEPLLAFLEEWPSTAGILGEDALPAINHTLQLIWKSPNGKAITPFLQTLAAVARRLPSREQMQHYLDLTLDLMERTSGSIHGIHKSFASPACPTSLRRHRSCSTAWRSVDCRTGSTTASATTATTPTASAPTSACSQPTAARSSSANGTVRCWSITNTCSTSACGDSGVTAPSWYRTPAALTRPDIQRRRMRLRLCSPTTTRPEFACLTSSTTPWA
jgi:hypothetical protein